MKISKFLFVALVLFAGVFVSCDKDDSDGQDTPGNIVGMGNAEGELEVTEDFEMPEGISFEGEILGDDQHLTVGEVTSNNLDTKSGYFRFGSGGHDIVLKMSLRNDSDRDRDCIFKRGFVFKCWEDGYQHGICAKRVVIRVPARTVRTCNVLLYCINQGKRGSSINARYIAKGVTASNRMMELINALEYKKINVDDFSLEDFNAYNAQCVLIQKIIWKLTNGKGMSNEDWEFIKSLPSLT